MPKLYSSTPVSGTSTANALQTVASTLVRAGILNKVTIKYSASASVSVTVTLVSALGAAYNVLLQTVTLSAATDAVYIPNDPITLASGDQISVVAPAGGGGITSSVAIYLSYR
jgi:hypothetical protein